MISRWQQSSGSSQLNETALTSRRVLVTGATGFIGGHLLERLVQQGAEASALARTRASLSRLQSRIPSDDVRPVMGDVTDIDSLRRAVADVDLVFHVAGVVKSLDYEGFRRVNEDGVTNLLAVCAERTTPPVVVVVSSLAAAGPAPGDRPRVEEDPICPVSNYGRSKRAGEVVAERWANRVPITVVRPSIVFGEYDSAMLNLFRPIRQFRFHLVPGFRPRRLSLIHVDDLATMLLLSAEKGRRLAAPDTDGDRAGYYLAAGDETPTMHELGVLIGRATGHERVWIVHAPELMAWCVGAGADVVSHLRRTPSVVGLDKIREAVAGSWTCSAGRAQRELGFQVQTSLSERLRQTAEFYFRAGWLA